jgi:hypothetical protein
MRYLAPLLALPFLFLAPACKQRQTLPDIHPGWHTPGYDVILGRVLRKPPADPNDAPTWILRYGLSNAADPYGGEVALMPQEALVGYGGGELVEVKGSVDPGFKSGTYAGTWYRVSEIRIWNGSETR